MSLQKTGRQFLIAVAMAMTSSGITATSCGQGLELLLERQAKVHTDPPGPTCPGCCAEATQIALEQFGYPRGISIHRLPPEDGLRVANLARLMLSEFAKQARQATSRLESPPGISLERLTDLKELAISEVESNRRDQELKLEREQRLADKKRRKLEGERKARESRLQQAKELFSKLEGLKRPVAFVTFAESGLCVIDNKSLSECTIEEAWKRIQADTIVVVDEAFEDDAAPHLRELKTISDVRRVDASGAVSPLARLRNAAGAHYHVDGTELGWLASISELSAHSDGSPIVFAQPPRQGTLSSESVVVADRPSPDLQEDVRRVTALLAECELGERRLIWEIARTWTFLDVARLQKAIRVVKAPVIVADETEDGLTLRLNAGQSVDYRELGGDLPDEWKQAILGGICIVDVSRVGNHALKADLCQRLRQAEQANNDEVRWLLATRPDSRKRLAMMHGSDSFEFVTDDSIAKVANKGSACLAALRQAEQSTRNKSGVRVRVLAGHEGAGTQVVAKWIEEAKRSGSTFTGLHLVVVACNVRPDQMYEFVNVAIDNGALSVSVPYETVSLHALTLASQRVGKIQVAGDSPLDYWRRCYDDARSAIEICRGAAEPMEALRAEFGEAAKLFEGPSGTLDQERLEEVIKQLKSEPDRFGPSFGINERHCPLVFTWNRRLMSSPRIGSVILS